MNAYFIEDIEIKSIKNCDEIKSIILSFDPIFPHLKEKISSYDDYAKKLSEYANVVICKINQETAGLLVFYSNDIETKTAYISLIGVHQEYQGKKIGKILLEYCINASINCGMEYLKLEVDLDNTRAIRFYVNNGFENCEDSNGSSVHMCKKIK